MHNILLATVAVASLAALASPIASANVIYVFESAITPPSGAPRTLPDLSITLELTEALNSFSLAGSAPTGGPLAPLVDDVDRFVALTLQAGSLVETVTRVARTSGFTLDLLFNVEGVVTSNAFDFRGSVFDVRLFGNRRALGFIGAEQLGCSVGTGGTACDISGVWRLQSPIVPVPEPMSLALLAIGLASIGVACRRKCA